MSTVIKVDNVSKLYRLGQIGTGSLSHDVNRLWHRLLGKQDPYLKVGESNDRTAKGASEYVWALKDVGFSINQGEVLGIIGRNGAGKSTLLKILSRTTTPTKGSIKVKGRIASLLEVGTGFHPELSGRDNIYLNGAILGMNKREIQKKFDEIVDFAGVERYIDTPVKRYSSGMYVRLAFAVAAHLEPEILIVDEVLAVGDAEFQQKCLGKMKDVSVNGGRTVLFVSHNMSSIKALCSRCLLMENGTLIANDTPTEIINKYLSTNSVSLEQNYIDNVKLGDDEIFITSFGMSANGEYKRVFSATDKLVFEFNYKAVAPQKNFRFIVYLSDQTNSNVSITVDGDNLMYKSRNIEPGVYKGSVTFPANFFNEGVYYIDMDAGIFNEKSVLGKWSPFSFLIEDVHADFAIPEGKRDGPVLTFFDWEHKQLL